MSKDLEPIEAVEVSESDLERDAEQLAPSLELFEAAFSDELEQVDFSQFSEQVMTRVEHAVASELEQELEVADMLRAEVDEAVDAREGDWSSFLHQVQAEIGVETKAESRLTPARRAELELSRAVKAELDQVEPRFENAFAREVQKKIELEQQKTWWSRTWDRWTEMRESWGMGVGFATASAAVFLLLVFAPRIDNPQPPRVNPVVNATPPGEVLVEEVSFEGDVMVMQGDGVTFVYLSESEQS